MIPIEKGEWQLSATSPFYLGSGDQSGNMIRHVIFSGENYVAWAREMMLFLRARRKFVFIDGSVTKLNEPKLDWETVH